MAGLTPACPQMSSDEADALFGNDNNQELGLSILPMRIDPGGSRNSGTELHHDVRALRANA